MTLISYVFTDSILYMVTMKTLYITVAQINFFSSYHGNEEVWYSNFPEFFFNKTIYTALNVTLISTLSNIYIFYGLNIIK